jgi:hypothetical protein
VCATRLLALGATRTVSKGMWGAGSTTQVQQAGPPAAAVTGVTGCEGEGHGGEPPQEPGGGTRVGW